jgi:methionyl-tRNA formyltransferase
VNEKTYIVATIKSWNQEAFHRHTPALPGRWVLMDQRDQLTLESVTEFKPRYVFFPHWSWKVPNAVLDAAECVCFHMTDVPYGRGGSPLQNLIQRGHETTMLSALRMTEELDAGPVYLKRPLDLSGRAQDIYKRAADVVYNMIGEILERQPEPQPQEGDAVPFERRTPEQSRLPVGATPRELYDHIRMLDAETYPPAFTEQGSCRIELRDAQLSGDQITAKAVIRFMGE